MIRLLGERLEEMIFVLVDQEKSINTAMANNYKF